MDKLLKLSNCEFHVSFGLSVVFTFGTLIVSHTFFRVDASADPLKFVILGAVTAVVIVIAALSIYDTYKRL